MVTQQGSVTPKRKQNVKGAQKKGMKRKSELMNNKAVNAEVKGSGKRKELDGGINEKSGQKKLKTEENTVENVSIFPQVQFEENLMEDMVTEKSKVNGIASPASKSEGKKQKKKMKGEVNGTASKQMEVKENGIVSPKTEAKNKKKMKKAKLNKAKKETWEKCKKIWGGLPFEENERMTKYEGVWVKKEAVGELDELKAGLEEEGLGEEEILKKVTKAKNRSHSELRKELMNEVKKLEQQEEGKGDSQKKVEYITEGGKRLKVLRDGRVRPWIDLPYMENERMTKYEAMWVKKEVVSELDELRDSLRSQDLSKAEIAKQMMKAKRKAHQELHKELVNEQKKNRRNQSSIYESEFLTCGDGQRVKILRDRTRRVLYNLPFEENELMTKYDSVWVKQEMVSKLDKLKASLQDEGLSEHVIIVKMKRAKARAHKKLKMKLIHEQLRLKKVQKNSPGSKKTISAEKTKVKKTQKTDAVEQVATEKKKMKKLKKGKNDTCKEEVTVTEENKVKKMEKKVKKGKNDTGKEEVTVTEKKKVKKMENGLGKQGVTEKKTTKGKTGTGKQGVTEKKMKTMKGKTGTGKQGVTEKKMKTMKKGKTGAGKQEVTEKKMKTMKKGKTGTGKQGKTKMTKK